MGRDLFGWIAVGLIMGLTVKLLTPGRDPGGFVVALLLGLAGALGAGFLAVALRGPALDTAESLGWAAAGAAALVLLYRLVMFARTR